MMTIKDTAKGSARGNEQGVAPFIASSILLIIISSECHARTHVGEGKETTAEVSFSLSASENERGRSLQLAQAETIVDFKIDAPSLARALIQLTEQSGMQLIYPAGDKVVDLPAKPLTGKFTPEAALKRLLNGTDLEYEFIDAKTISIVGRAAKSPPVKASQSGVEGAAAADTGPQATKSSAVHTSDGFDDSQSSVEEIIVTGSRLKRFANEGPSPVITFGRDEFERLGITSVADVFSYLPQSSFSMREDTTAGGARAIQLRGLNLGTTLVLINGRRVVTSALQSARNFFDMNMIPLAAVDRIDVLSDGASAVYGADALGGVINVILKKDMDRPVMDVYVGGAEGGAEEHRASLSFGVDTERLRGTFAVDVFDRDALMGSERSLFANQDFRRFGGMDARMTAGNPGNVYALSGGPLPGLTNAAAGVPAGSSGIGLTPADFSRTDGILNRESRGRFQSIVPETTRIGAFGTVEFDLGDTTTAFAELLYTHSQNSRRLTPAALENGAFGGYIVPASNPFNPFGVPVGVDYMLTGLGSRLDETDSEFVRALAGLRGRVGSYGWDWNVAITHSNDRANSVLENEIDPLRVITALGATDPAQALNVFQDGPGGSPELLRSLIRERVVDRATSASTQVDGYMSGPVFDLPAGPVEMVVGGEWREEKIDTRFRSFGIITAADRGSRAAFGEVLVPLVDADMAVPLVRRLSFTAAGRLDRYSDVGETFNPQFRLEWKPYTSLLVRASVGTAFRAPSLFELHQATVAFSGVTVSDPRWGGQSVAVDLLGGGNEDLDPEEADTLVAGFMFQPQFLKGFELSVDYWHIDQSQRVLRTDMNTILRNEAMFPERVSRAAPTSADIAAGRPGRLLSVDASNLNFGGVDTRGFDFRSQYRFHAGMSQIVAALAATYVRSFKVADFPGQPARERVGVAHLDGTVPEWKATASLSWSLRGLQLGATARYTHGYDDTNITGALTGREIDAVTMVDLQTAYAFDRARDSSTSWLDGVVLRAGAINAFDREPQYSEVAYILGYDPSQADLRQRFIYVSASKTF